MKTRFKEVIFATYLGIVVNVFLTIVKIIVGILSGSKALIADAAHSASDVIGSIAVLAGVRVAQKPPDDEHPYGHGKAENISTFIVAILLIIVAVEIGISSFQVFLGEPPTPPSTLALYVIIFDIFAKELLFHYKIRLGKKHNSTALIAEAWHHRSDSLSSIAALVGIGGAILGGIFDISILVYLDPLAGLVVSCMVLYMGYKLGKESSNVMMEQVLSKEAIRPFIETVAAVDGVVSIDQIHARTHGHYVIIDIKIGVPATLNIEEAHRISKVVKKELVKNHEEVRDVFIHINPNDKQI